MAALLNEEDEADAGMYKDKFGADVFEEENSDYEAKDEGVRPSPLPHLPCRRIS